MQILKHFENFEAIQSEIESIKNFLSMAYIVKSTKILNKDSKYIVIDDKIVYLSGPLSTKSKMVDRMFLEVSDHFPDFNASSIRMAIKDFFDFHK